MLVATVIVGSVASTARAQTAAVGYASERFNPVAPGNSWLVMDELKLEGPLGGGISFVSSYARHPVRVSLPGSSRTLSVVSDQAFVDVGLTVLIDRFRFTLDLPDPAYAAGQSGTLGAYKFNAPLVNFAKYPDKISDVRFAFDSRLLGSVDGPWRIGVSAQLFVPSGERADYVTDNTYRSVLRAQFAGNWGLLNHAAYLGVHIRPRDDSVQLSSPSLGGPRGSEFVFGFAAAPEFVLGSSGLHRLRVGPEVFGESAFKSAFGKSTTALEALLSANYTHTNRANGVVRLKLGVGRGLVSDFGAPTWRTVVGLEITGRVHR